MMLAQKSHTSTTSLRMQTAKSSVNVMSSRTLKTVRIALLFGSGIMSKNGRTKSASSNVATPRVAAKCHIATLDLPPTLALTPTPAPAPAMHRAALLALNPPCRWTGTSPLHGRLRPLLTS